MRHLIVDGANVVGSRPDGWWRDRAAAARRLAGRLVDALTAEPPVLGSLVAGPAAADVTVHLVLEGAARRACGLLPTDPRLHVVPAPADGDTTIAGLAAELSGDPVTVVTADRALRDRVHATGATTVGPSALLALLPGGATPH